MPLLNGKHVDASAIDPAKHRYVGMFRPPWPLPGIDTQDQSTRNLWQCPMGHIVEGTRGVRSCYTEGHHDEPQYVDINQRTEYLPPNQTPTGIASPSSAMVGPAGTTSPTGQA